MPIKAFESIQSGFRSYSIAYAYAMWFLDRRMKSSFKSLEWLSRYQAAIAPVVPLTCYAMALFFFVVGLEIKREFLSRKTLRMASGFDRMLALPVPQAIVSGSTRDELRMMLANIHMPADAVDFILCDEDGGAGKPDPQGFLRALERFGVKPSEAMVFEDSPAGIEAAKRAGIPVAFVAELASRDNAALADIRFASFAEAWGWVRERIAPR